MPKYRPHRARYAIAVSAAVLASVAPVSAADSAQWSPGSHTVPGAPSGADPAPVLLINGDQLAVSPAPGGEAVTLGAVPDPDPILTLHLGGISYVMPADAIPYLGRGLDPSLFDLSLLRMHEQGGKLRVRLSFAGAAPALPGVTITSAHGGVAVGYLTAASAKAFGRALADQFAAEHGAGNYSTGRLFGGVHIALAGATLPATSRPRFPMHTLVVNATNKSGRPDTGDVVFVLNADNPLRFDEPLENINLFYHGTARYSMPAGHYWAVAAFFTPRTISWHRHIITQRLVVLPQFTVAGHTTNVHMSAKAATSEASITTPRLTNPGVITWTISRTSPQRPAGVSAMSTIGPMWISPLKAKHIVGTLVSATETTRSSPANASVPYYYLLDYVSRPDVIPTQHFITNPASLATITQRYYSTTQQKVLWEVFGGTEFQIFDPFIIAEVKGQRTIPGTQTLYLTTGSNLAWFSHYALLNEQRFENSRYTLRPGQNLTEGFSEFPLHMQPDVQLLTGSFAKEFADVPSAVRSGNELTFSLNPFTDSTNEFGQASISPFGGHYLIRQNGTRIAGGNFFGFMKAKVSAKASLIKLSVSADQADQSALSPHTYTVWTLHTAPQPHAMVGPAWYCYDSHLRRTQQCAVQPLLTLDYQVSHLGLDGVAPTGPQAISVRVGHIQLARQPAIMSAAAQVSFDGGKTWQPATVTKVSAGNYQVAFDATTNGDVTLKFMAGDAAGGSVSDTVTNAYIVAGPAARPAASLQAACPATPPSHLRCFVLYRPQNPVNRAIAAGITGKPSRPVGLTPRELQAAYRLPVSSRSRRTVAVSIAFNTPHLASYLAKYRGYFKLPPCTAASGCFRVVNEYGRSDPKRLPPSGVRSGWDLEATLDVSMISAACPHCKIIVVEAKSTSLGDLARTDDTAAAMGAQVISNSYGGRETGSAVAFAKSYDHPGHTIVVSSGDGGYSAANFPADLSTVTAVGGTTLAPAHNKRGWRERTWTDFPFAADASGCSAYEPKPAWQHDPHCPGRTVADVSAVASNVPVYNPTYGGWVTVAGTSVSAPLVAGIYALAGNAARLRPGFAYRHRRFLFDVTKGSNSFFVPSEDDCGNDYLCVAKKGYDAPTGLGTPDGIGAF